MRNDELTADHVARAIIAACWEANENPRLAAKGWKGEDNRARHYALHALMRAFPDMSPSIACQLFGVEKPGYWSRSIGYMHSAWWNPAALERVVSAILLNGKQMPEITGLWNAAAVQRAKDGMPPRAAAPELAKATGKAPPAAGPSLPQRPMGIAQRLAMGGGGYASPGVTQSQSKTKLYDELRKAVENTAKLVNARGSS